MTQGVALLVGLVLPLVLIMLGILLMLHGMGDMLEFRKRPGVRLLALGLTCATAGLILFQWMLERGFP